MRGPLAHPEEQGTFNPKVPGSRPGRPTTQLHNDTSCRIGDLQMQLTMELFGTVRSPPTRALADSPWRKPTTGYIQAANPNAPVPAYTGTGPGRFAAHRSHSGTLGPPMAGTITTASSEDRPRKRLRKRRRGARLRLLLGVGLLVGGLTVFSVASSHIDLLTAHGVRVSAIVVGNDGRGCEFEDTPHLLVEFPAESGHQVRDNLAIGGTGCRSYTVGKHVIVYYNGTNPSDAAVGDGNADIGFSGWFGLLLLVGGTAEVGEWVWRSHGVRAALATVAHTCTEVNVTQVTRRRVALAFPLMPGLQPLQMRAFGDSEELIAARHGSAYCEDLAPSARVVVQADDFVIWGRLRSPR